MKKSYIAPNFKAKNIQLSTFMTISDGNNDINSDPITQGDQIGAKQNSIFDRTFSNDEE